MKRVGIIGASGKIGLMAAREIEGFCQIKGGSRHYKKCYESLKNFYWQKVDLYNEESLCEFCSDCDIILNCAGPAVVVEDKVATVAGNFKIPYVDTSDIVLVDKAIKKSLPNDSVYVVGSGYVPGLGGLLLKWLACRQYDDLNLVKCYQCGIQKFSEIAFVDIVFGSLSGESKGDSYYRRGRILKEHNLGIIKRNFPSLEKEYEFKSFLSDEMIDTASKYNIKELHWFNNVENKQMSELVMDSVKLLLSKGKKSALKEINENAKKYANLSMDNEEEWSKIIIECRGKLNNEKKESFTSFDVNKEEEACGLVVGLVIKKLVTEKVKNGIYYPHDIITANEIELFLSKIKKENFTTYEIDREIEYA